MWKFLESGQIIFSLKVYKNFFSQVMDRNFVKNVIICVNLVKIGHFWKKLSNLGHFGVENDAIGPPFRVGRKYFFLKTVSNVI